MSEPLWDVNQTSEYLLVKQSWVYTNARNGKLPCTYIGRYPRFRKSKLDKWLDENETGQ